jgi:hypothetical protein
VRRLARALALVMCTLALVLSAIACQPSAGTSFQPEGACAADGRAPGTYPDLEARLPSELGGVARTTVDSGRSCSPHALSTYASHGIGEIRYAGATWAEGAQDGTVIAVFVAGPGQPPLDQAWVQEFYESGARTSTKTENIEIDMPQLPSGGRYWRLQTLNDLSLQTVAVWGGDPGIVHVVIVATQVQPGASRSGHDDRVDRAVQAVVAMDAPAARAAKDPVLPSAA